MAIESIASVKSHFQSGDRPTQEEFANLIDTLGRTTPIAIASAAEGGKTGVYEILSDGDVTARETGAFGLVMLSAASTTAAHNLLGLTSGVSSFGAAFVAVSGASAASTLLATASTTRLGVVEKATEAEIEAGTADKFVEAENLRSAFGFSKFFESSEQTVTADTLLAVAHGLGTTPKLTQLILRCKTADAGYAVDDEVDYSGALPEVNDRGLSILVDDTNVSLIQSSAFLLVGKSTFNTATITTSSWRWIVRAWA